MPQRKPQKEFLLSEQTGQIQQSNICFISVYFLLKDHLEIISQEAVVVEALAG
eukprot:01517.XXX_6075_4701_1 [CDS] Oithona nana genome sequencing.